MRCLWDTDVLSEFLRGKHPHIVWKSIAYLTQYGQASISLITRYEILLGLKAKNATAQLAVFEAWCQRFQILPITDDIIVSAADLWSILKRIGQLIGDNDLLIAATALHYGLSLATKNVAHLNRIPGLAVEDWSIP
jgi:tRNA(fMet)-specific endonuclease VapC